ncbi:MAG TPA: tyrosine-type recombinase/integrase [Casimicrobiaceae bacterium]|jgi:hypothetical protein|nr:tyrosine-type recombinase/integrase [Casimicrobiaceae bacterium]
MAAIVGETRYARSGDVNIAYQVVGDGPPDLILVGLAVEHRGLLGRPRRTAWQNARKNAGLLQVRVHDLKHTFGRRLRTAGVPLETRKVLLGHKTGDITSHYSAPELAELIRAANAVLKAQESTLLRVVTKQDQVVYREKSRKSRARISSVNRPTTASFPT